jgi:hypothetical protein
MHTNTNCLYAIVTVPLSSWVVIVGLFFPIAGGLLGTSSAHIRRRKRALVHYIKSADNQVQKQSKNKRAKVQPFERGDYVTVRIPPQDRMSTDMPRLPAVVVEIRGTKRISYRLRSKYGVLERLYDDNNLEGFSGMIDDLSTSHWENDKKISLREAVRCARQERGGLPLRQCKCKKGCVTARCCPCLKSGNVCHSKCHRGLRCKNFPTVKSFLKPRASSTGDCRCICSNSCTVLKKCSCRLNKKLCSPKCHRGRRCCNFSRPEKNDIVILENDINPTINMRNQWLPHLQLDRGDELRLLGGRWLYDTHISAAQRLLREQFSTIDGLVSPLVGTAPGGFPAAMHGAVQIHYNEQHHWVTSTAGVVGSNSSGVYVYDSLSTGRLLCALRRQLADMYRVLADKDGKIEVTIKAVQQQSRGMGNCGPFAVAFATALCHGIDPNHVSFSERSLRKHLHACFQSGTLTCFPEATRNVAKSAEVKTSVSIYCFCYSHLPGTEMIRCDDCDNWFHLNCVDPSWKATAKITQQETWYCRQCAKEHA